MSENSDTELTDEDKVGLVAAFFIVVGSFFYSFSLGFVAAGICVLLMLYAGFLDERKKDLKRLIRATEKVQDQQEQFLTLLSDKTTREHFAKIGNQDGAVGTDGNGGVIKKPRRRATTVLR